MNTALQLLHKKQVKTVLALVFILIISYVAHSFSFFCADTQAYCETDPAVLSSTTISEHYFTYSDQLLSSSLTAQKRVVLYFHAPWCTTCSDFDSELKDSPHSLPENTIVLQISYDTAKDLKAKYNVAYQHTLILLSPEGDIQEMWIGGNLEALQSYLK